MRTNRPLLVRGCLLAFATLLGLRVCADTNRYAGPVWAPVDLKQATDAAAEITSAGFPDCDEATVEKKMVRVYRTDGTAEAQDDAFTKVLTEKGKRNNRTLSLRFELPYTTVEVARLEVIKPSGEVVPVDLTANSKETIDNSQMQMNIFDPRMKVLRVSIPALEAGDVVHALTRRTTERPIIPGEFAEATVLEGGGFIRHMSYEIHAPAERPLTRIALRDPVAGTVNYSTHPGQDNTTLHHWEITHVPRMYDEPGMPPYETVLQRLRVSTTPDWPAVSRWYWDLSKPHLDATTPEMKQTVEELTRQARTDLDKVKALFYHVSKKVRYMGLTTEKDRPGWEPHDAGITFEKKYGVCRDKAALLVSLLRLAGLRAYPVLINPGSKKDPEVAEADFIHAITAVELVKGEYVLMDPTDENTRDLLPAFDRDQSFLVCRPEGEDIHISAIAPPEDNLMRVKTTGVLTPAGSLEARSELWFQGVNDDMYRNTFAQLKPDDQRRFFEAALKQAMPGARLKSLKLIPEDVLDVSQELRATLEFSVDGLTATGGGKSVVGLPWIGKGLGLISFVTGNAGLDKRKYPMQTWLTCGVQEDISLILAEGFGAVLALPSSPPSEDVCVTYRQTFSVQGGALNASRTLKLKVVEFSPAQYLTLKQTLKDLEYDARKSPVLAVSAPAAAQPAETAERPPDSPVTSDARLLESHKELEILDAHSSISRVRYSKRILTYAGKIREAEVKIHYNPACQEARFIRAAVTSKMGQRQEISKGEINVLDEGWNASAKRYTGGKILVANLPGVDLGSTLEVEYEITTKDRPFLAGFEPFQLPDEVERKSFQLTAPANLRIEKMISGPPGLVKEDSRADNGKQIFQWTAENLKALPAESQLPPEWAYLSGVGYFVGEALASVKELNETLLERSRQRAKTEALARQLTKDARTQLEGLKTLRNYVAKSVRIAGPSFSELPLRELSAADTTLSDGYGHLADRAILLHALLDAAGFEPQFVLASDLPVISGITNIAMAFPLPGAFPTLLVKVILDGETWYLNDTDQYDQLGSTSHDGRLGIALASPAWEFIKAVTNCQDRTETTCSMSFDDTGKTRLGVARHFFGNSFGGKNRFFSELPPEERKRHFQELVSNVAQGARPIGELTTKFDAYPGLEQFTVEIDHYAVVDGKYLYFALPYVPSLFSPDADRRALPWFIGARSQSSVRTEIELPSGFSKLVIAPQSDCLTGPGGSGQARITVTQTPGKCVLNQEIETAPAIVSPKDYAAILKVESALGRNASKMFLLEKE